jgi:hypothetical protein
VGRVLGEQPGDEWPEAEAAHVRDRGGKRCPAAGRSRDQLGQRGRGRSRYQASGEPGQDPAEDENPHVRATMNTTVLSALLARATASTGLRPAWSRRPSRQQQGGQDPGGIDGEGHRHDGRGEMPPRLVDDVQRGRQRRAEHGGGQHGRKHPERDPAGNGRPSAPGSQQIVQAVDTGLVGCSPGSSRGDLPPDSNPFGDSHRDSSGRRSCVFIGRLKSQARLGDPASRGSDDLPTSLCLWFLGRGFRESRSLGLDGRLSQWLTLLSRPPGTSVFSARRRRPASSLHSAG